MYLPSSGSGFGYYSHVFKSFKLPYVFVVVDSPIIEDVAEVAQAQHLQGVVLATPRPIDLEEERKVQKFCT